MSTQDSSSSSSRKRKSPFDSPTTPRLTNKRRKSVLSLRKEYLEQHSEVSNDSMHKFEDEDTTSLTSISVASLPSAKMSTNSTERDYASMISTYKINLRTATKHYAILQEQPVVMLPKILPIKRELLSPSILAVTTTSSPIFIPKKKNKKKRSNREKDTSRTVRYDTTYDDDRVASSSIQHEPFDNTQQLKKKMNKRAKRNVENYLQTLYNKPIKIEKYSSAESSPPKQHSLSRPIENEANDSENEFQISKLKKRQKTVEKQTKTSDFVVNPLSKDNQGQTNSQISKKKQSFWSKKFGSFEPSSRKRKFLETFIKKENESGSETDHENEIGNGTVERKEQIGEKNSEIAKKNGTSKGVNRRRARIFNPVDDDEDTDNDIDIQTYDSLSVNCHHVNADSENHLKENNIQISPLMSFGEGYEQNEEDNNDQLQGLLVQDDIIDMCAGSPGPLEIDEETPCTSNNFANGVDESSNDSASGVDLSPSGSLVIDLHPESSTELSPTRNISTKSKGKPKIKSCTKLKNPIFNIPGRRKQKKPIQGTSPASQTSESSKVQSPSKTGNSKKLDLNGTSQKIKINSGTPTTRGLKSGLQQAKCNLNNEESVKEYQSAKNNAAFSNADESFDKICQDVTNLSNFDGITLYKGTEETADEILILADSLEKGSRKKRSASSAKFNNNLTEMQLEIESSDGSNQQKTTARITRSSILLNADSPPVNTFRGFPKIPRKETRLNKSAASSNTLSQSRDPRLNRSLSPNKPISVPATEVRVTRSNGQKSSSVSSADPRLTRGQSRPRSESTTIPSPTTNISPRIEKGEEINIVDPRLRKRKEREEVERAAKLAQERENSKIHVSIFEPQEPEVSQFGRNSPAPERKTTRGVFNRLGGKQFSPIRTPEQNELLNIIKSNKPSSPKKAKGYETDDDIVSMHPNISDYFDFSDDEDGSDSSPRHRKFESERNRTSTAGISTVQQSATQQRPSVRDRLGRVGDFLSNRRAPITAPSESSKLAPPIRTTTTTTVPANNTLANRLGTRAPSQQTRIPPATTRATIATVAPPNVSVPPPNVSVPPPLIKTSKTTNGSYLDSFYQMNAKQMMQDQDDILMETEDQKVYFDGSTDEPSEFDHRSILDNTPDSVVIGLSDPKFTYFNKQCYRMLRDGICRKALTTCHFQHQIDALLRKIKTNDPPFIKAILNTSIELNFDFYLVKVWNVILPIIKDDAFNVFEKLYQEGKRNQNFVMDLLNYNLSANAYTVDTFLRKIAGIIDVEDCETVQAICASIKSKLADGFCWETIKVICKKVAPPTDMVELVLLQCLKRKKNRVHILEVNDLIKTKLPAFERDKLGPSLLKQFYELVARQNPSTKDTDTSVTMPLMNVTNNLTNGSSLQRRSVNVQKPAVQPGIAKSDQVSSKKGIPLTPKSPDNTSNTSPTENAQTPIIGESMILEYSAKKIDPPVPKSIFRDRFWKLYASVENVTKGLSHMDYDYVWEQLDKFCQEPVPNELVKRAFYQILCQDVKKVEHHLTEILKRAAKKSSEKFTGLLFEVGMHALIDLGDNALWVMAAELLKNLAMFQPEVPHVIFVLISAEIHLANSDPVEALCLLQRTKLIRTNRDEWAVTDSIKADEKHRNNVVFILLQALAHLEPEKAVFLFKELMADQYIHYYPIDLSRYVDKLTLLLFVHKRLDLAVEIARLVMSNDMTFQKSTYQEILSRLLAEDDVVVNQILEYAVNLGYYPDIKIRGGFTTMIIDMNYTEEEIYLMLKRLIHKLIVNLGPMIPRLKSSHLKVTLVFEDIPSGKRLYKNDTVSKINFNKNRSMKSLVADILSNRFLPPIKLSQGRADRFCKIMSRTLVDHLKHWH